MCTTCGCGDTELVPVELHEKILAVNDRTARHNREHFAARGVLAVNLMGSPGAGKTAVLEATARGAAGAGWRLAAVSADLATDNDARRLEAAGIPSRAITTGQACHLDAELVHRSLHGFDLDGADLFFIENVGNLVCPAIYDLGQRANVVVLSVAEGEDKPLKYPVMFKAADLVLVTKTDLAGVLGVDLARIEENLARVMPRPRSIRLSARTGEGMADWIAWLAELRRSTPTATDGAHSHDHSHDHSHGHSHDHSNDHSHGHDHGESRLQPHAHEHAHEHRHGAHTHTHAHVHAHSHDGGHATVEAEQTHAHEGGGDHDHAHFRDQRRPPKPTGARRKGGSTKRARSPSRAAAKGSAKKGGPRRGPSRRR